jgi:regulator of cell morphogenesis and NO signaling
MAQQITKTVTVQELVVTHPELREPLEKLGIDYCCGGKHTLQEAAAEKHVDLDKVLAGLNKALATPAKGDTQRDWSKASLTELTEHIVARHHAFTKEQLPRLEHLLAKVVVAHGAKHGKMLRALAGVFTPFKAEIDAHLLKEETILFPAIRKTAGRGGAAGSLAAPIAQIEHEHQSAGQALARMRELTSEYALPGDACPTFAALYAGLAAIEADLHEHIHLENNILFPRVLCPQT